MNIKNLVGPLISIASVVGLLSGCAQMAMRPDASSATAANETGFEYRIGAGDRLSVFVWRNPDLSVQAIPVRPDGKISSPLVEDMQAAGRTPAALAQEIEKVLSNYVKEPVVTVTVTDFMGASSDQVRVTGEVRTPKSFPYRQDMTLLDVLIDVGGFTDFASGNRSTLVRSVGGKQQAFRVRLDDLLKDGDITANMALQPGDVIIVPESIL